MVTQECLKIKLKALSCRIWWDVTWLFKNSTLSVRLKYWPLSRVRGLCIILTWEYSKIWLVLKCFVYFQLELLAVIPHSGIVLGHYFLKIRLRQELLFWDSAEDGVKIWACLGLICFCPICFQSNWDIFPLWILTISILWDIFLF